MMDRFWPFSLALLLHVAIAFALWQGVRIAAPLAPSLPVQTYLASLAEPSPVTEPAKSPPPTAEPAPSPPPAAEPAPPAAVKPPKPAAVDRSRELRQHLDLEDQLRAEELARQDKAQAEAAASRARAEAAQRLREQLMQEDLRNQTQREAARRNEAAELMARAVQQIKSKVSRYWSAAQVKPDLRCQVRVRLDPAGNVLRVGVTKSSGNSAFDSAVENAILSASPLPLPNRPDLYDEFKEITFYFSAQDL